MNLAAGRGIKLQRGRTYKLVVYGAPRADEADDTMPRGGGGIDLAGLLNAQRDAMGKTTNDFNNQASYVKQMLGASTGTGSILEVRRCRLTSG